MTTARAEFHQIPARGTADWHSIAKILDLGFTASVGFVVDGQPFVIPMLYGRSDRMLYLHGAAASRIMTKLDDGVPVCATVTLVDGLVLARSAFHHSMNYRSVLAFDIARAVTDVRAKIAALRCMSDHLLEGRWEDVRAPTKGELAVTTVLEMEIDEASAKVRAGPPIDDEADYHRPTWAGEIPLALTALTPISDVDGPLPSYLVGTTRFETSRPRVVA